MPPTADFTASPNPALVNQTITFDGSASTDNDEAGCCVERYFWSFGDGTTATTSAPTTTHAYAVPGTYRASLVVTDDEGETGAAERLIEVTEPAGEQQASGAGSIFVNGERAHFGFDVAKSADGTVSGRLSYKDKARQTEVQSETLTSLAASGGTATFSGTCTVNKQTGFTFTVELIDNGEPGNRDVFTIRISSGYEASGTIEGGNIKVRE